MIFLLDATALVHVMYHITEKDPPDVVERTLNRMEHLQQWSEQTAEKFDEIPCQFAVFDNGGKSFRAKRLPTYKAQRTHDAEIYECLDHTQESLRNSSGWTMLVAPEGFEADDLIASIAWQVEDPVMIHSADKDFHQCLEDGRVGLIKKSGVNSDPKFKENGAILFGSELTVETYTERDLRKEFGFPSTRWVDYQCLVGDAADNVSGARWVGDVTARRIIQDHGPLEDLDPDELKLNPRQREEWPAFIERLPLLRDIFTLRTDLTHFTERTQNEGILT